MLLMECRVLGAAAKPPPADRAYGAGLPASLGAWGAGAATACSQQASAGEGQRQGWRRTSWQCCSVMHAACCSGRERLCTTIWPLDMKTKAVPATCLHCCVALDACCVQDGLGPRVSLFLSDVETDTWSQKQLEDVTSSCDRVIVTLGEKGARLMVNGSSSYTHIPVVKVRACISACQPR